ncbi:hypothetical protein, partial [Flavobacterium covae]|uniref:hypothetical protein n=1 Tax=Flavobacterium covae TaxID=2906076 RepID=UPI001F3FC95E
ESRIRTCEGFPTDLQSVLVGRLSISPSLDRDCLIAVQKYDCFLDKQAFLWLFFVFFCKLLIFKRYCLGSF